MVPSYRKLHHQNYAATSLYSPIWLHGVGLVSNNRQNWFHRCPKVAPYFGRLGARDWDCARANLPGFCRVAWSGAKKAVNEIIIILEAPPLAELLQPSFHSGSSLLSP